MAFTEEGGACHLVDTRTMTTRQTLRIDERASHNISGLCFSPDVRFVILWRKRSDVWVRCRGARSLLGLSEAAFIALMWILLVVGDFLRALFSE